MTKIIHIFSNFLSIFVLIIYQSVKKYVKKVTSMETLKVIGENVRKLRQLSDIKQEDLALKLGKSIKWLSQLENGLIDPHLSEIDKLAANLHTNSETLLSTSIGNIFNNYHQQGTYIANQQNHSNENHIELMRSHIALLERQLLSLEKQLAQFEGNTKL
jgi:transcriptional regulator with XRE-family HTH domain